VPDEVHIRCRYQRQGNQILEYTHQATWQPIVRYDNARGFCHRDLIHVDGTQDKTPIYRGDANANFTWAIKELRMNWQSHRSRFLAEIKP
jgi:hypothetical protein